VLSGVQSRYSGSESRDVDSSRQNSTASTPSAPYQPQGYEPSSNYQPSRNQPSRNHSILRPWEGTNPAVINAFNQRYPASERYLASDYYSSVGQYSQPRQQHQSQSLQEYQPQPRHSSCSSAPYQSSTHLSASTLRTHDSRHRPTTALSEWEERDQRDGPYFGATYPRRSDNGCNSRSAR
jgi:hypothetical protein